MRAIDPAPASQSAPVESSLVENKLSNSEIIHRQSTPFGIGWEDRRPQSRPPARPEFSTTHPTYFPAGEARGRGRSRLSLLGGWVSCWAFGSSIGLTGTNPLADALAGEGLVFRRQEISLWRLRISMDRMPPLGEPWRSLRENGVLCYLCVVGRLGPSRLLSMKFL